jgi:hypothetical protein
MAIVVMQGCKKSTNADTTTTKSNSQILIDGGFWYTQKFTLTKPDNTTVTMLENNGVYLPNDSYIYSAQFFDTGYYFQDKQILSVTWSLSGTTLTMQDLTGTTAVGQITYIDANTFTVERTGSFTYSSQPYIKVDQVYIH